MAIEFVRSEARSTPGRDEVRLYYSGVEPKAALITDSAGNTFGARVFSFTFCGERYESLAYVYFRHERR